MILRASRGVALNCLDSPCKVASITFRIIVVLLDNNDLENYIKKSCIELYTF